MVTRKVTAVESHDRNNGHPLCPLLGFPNEEIVQGDAYKFYACRPIPERPEVIAAAWAPSDKFEVCLFRGIAWLPINQQRLTIGSNSISDRLFASDALEAQLLIFHLIQTLPTEVTQNVEAD
jgi:hypothetical protein